VFHSVMDEAVWKWSVKKRTVKLIVCDAWVIYGSLPSGARGSVAGGGTMLQAGRSLVRFSMKSLGNLALQVGGSQMRQ
jgi:hypothetical protein